MARKKLGGKRQWRTRGPAAHIASAGAADHEIAKRRREQRRRATAQYRAQLAADAAGGWYR